MQSRPARRRAWTAGARLEAVITVAASCARSVALTAVNQSFGAWGEVFGDRIIATAILDRLLHHAVTLNIRGNSYRLKEKLKAGLVRADETNDS